MPAILGHLTLCQEAFIGTEFDYLSQLFTFSKARREPFAEECFYQLFTQANQSATSKSVFGQTFAIC